VEIVIPQGWYRLEFDDPDVPLAFPVTVVAFSAQVATDDRLRDTKQKKMCLIRNVGTENFRKQQKSSIFILIKIFISVFIWHYIVYYQIKN
jgi:hypothetical protein